LMTRTEPRAVVISPFANERARQWPARNYRELIGLIWREHGFAAMIVGTRGQRAVANDLVRGLSSERAMNTCGVLSWEELIEAVDAAPYVVANNSGVAHLAAVRGRWTLCLFSGSHAYNEWMPRGPLVVTVGRALPCSPCELGTERCPNNVACMAELQPSEVFWVFDHVRNSLRAGGGDADLQLDEAR
jgi:ADP-heptose:LPS heptosyltransferase